MNRAEILQYFLKNYFGNDRQLLVEVTGYTMNQVESWLDRGVQPQEQDIRIRNSLRTCARILK